MVIENSNDSEIEIEVFPDRPDLLSHENLARAARSFLENVEAPCGIEVNHGPEQMVVDPSMEYVRPHVFAAIVRGVYTGNSDLAKDLFVQSLMDHQKSSTQHLEEKGNLFQLEYMTWEGSKVHSQFLLTTAIQFSLPWAEKGDGTY